MMMAEDDKNLSLPQKRYYRQRAHSNPIADHCFKYPVHPTLFDWSSLYPNIGLNQVQFADIGCGYGGFLKTLGEVYPDKYSVGMEIRVKVSDYVIDRISALRHLHPGQYNNIACLRTNAMKYLPNFFHKGQLEKMFFLYPDPHFKKAKHKWRIINCSLLSEYAYVIKPGGCIYTITDVKDLHDWIVQSFTEHPLFIQMSNEELERDILVEKLYESSEEGIKVSRNHGQRFLAVFKRL